jgi:hypothetical protein
MHIISVQQNKKGILYSLVRVQVPRYAPKPKHRDDPVELIAVGKHSFTFRPCKAPPPLECNTAQNL